MTTLQQEHSAVWERYIRQECRALQKAELAVVSKNHEAPRIPGKKIPREKSKPDFSGFFTAGGQHIVFEAKATLQTTRFDYDDLPAHQWEHLATAATAGATSFVYILDGERRKWVVPFWLIQEYGKERASFPLERDDFLATLSPQAYVKLPGETFLDTLWRNAELHEEHGAALEAYRAKHPIGGRR